MAHQRTREIIGKTPFGSEDKSRHTGISPWIALGVATNICTHVYIGTIVWSNNVTSKQKIITLNMWRNIKPRRLFY